MTSRQLELRTCVATVKLKRSTGCRGRRPQPEHSVYIPPRGQPTADLPTNVRKYTRRGCPGRQLPR
eukprot:4959993-Heterocapsa_arctica.AAC.1